MTQSNKHTGCFKEDEFIFFFAAAATNFADVNAKVWKIVVMTCSRFSVRIHFIFTKITTAVHVLRMLRPKNFSNTITSHTAVPTISSERRIWNLFEFFLYENTRKTTMKFVNVSACFAMKL